jgi:hypothetical protein
MIMIINAVVIIGRAGSVTHDQAYRTVAFAR